MFYKILNLLHSRGISGLLSSAYFFLFPIRAKSFQENANIFSGKNGIEVGGPSQVFTARGIFPVYLIVDRLDNCNFGGTTVWEGDIKEGNSFLFNSAKPAGRQYIVEATAMESICSESYDFVLSSHVLEHTANPILALSEWLRLLKEEGALVLLLPHKHATSDHHRPVTTMQHMIEDFNAGMGEDDLTHMPEILELHDLTRDPGAGDMASFEARSERNFENRCFHQHVFDTSLAVRLVDYMGLQIRSVEAIRSMHILIVAQKTADGVRPNNSIYLTESAAYRHKSPFQSDRL